MLKTVAYSDRAVRVEWKRRAGSAEASCREAASVQTACREAQWRVVAAMRLAVQSSVVSDVLFPFLLFLSGPAHIPLASCSFSEGDVNSWRSSMLQHKVLLHLRLNSDDWILSLRVCLPLEGAGGLSFLVRVPYLTVGVCLSLRSHWRDCWHLKH